MSMAMDTMEEMGLKRPRVGGGDHEPSSIAAVHHAELSFFGCGSHKLKHVAEAAERVLIPPI